MAAPGVTGLCFTELIFTVFTTTTYGNDQKVIKINEKIVRRCGIRYYSRLTAFEIRCFIAKFPNFNLVPHSENVDASTPSEATQTFLCIITPLSGDLELNPGPPKGTTMAQTVNCPCGICGKGVREGVQCDECDMWLHRRCIGMDNKTFQAHVDDASLEFQCSNCEPERKDEGHYSDELKLLRKAYPKNVITAYLNINSMQTK